MFTQKVILNLMSISGRKSFRVRYHFQKRNSFGITYIDVRFKKEVVWYYLDVRFKKYVLWYELDDLFKNKSFGIS